MYFLFSGILSAIVAFLVNRLGVAWLGIDAIVYFVPLTEEVAKTFLAYYLGTSIFLTHFFFGFIEAIYDFFNSTKKGLAAGAVSIIGHSLFGMSTTLVYFYSHDILLGMLVALALHIFWNGVVMNFFVT